MSERSDLRARFEELSNSELASILRRRDADEWRLEVFDVVRAILAARGIFSVDQEGLAEPSIERRVGEHDVVPLGEDAEAVATSLELDEAETCDRALRAAGLPAQIVPARYRGFSVYVAKNSGAKAVQLLREASLLPADSAPPPITDTGGACPACGASVEPGAGTCRACGLTV